MSVRGVYTSDVGTMAFETARKRWPVVVQQMIEDMEASVAEGDDPNTARDGHQIIHQLAELKRSMEANEPLTPLDPDGRNDISDYNAKLQELGALTWHAAPWLYTECYMYRRVHTLFANSTFWKEHDIFARQKSSTFASSRVAVQELASRFVQLNDDALEAEQARLLFEEMVHIALWGNATDLSLLSNLSLKEIQQLQGAAAIKRNERNIVANDTDKVWSYISEGLHQVDIVLDNSGFEYFTDLIFALYLLKQHLAQKIVLHVKDIPWFVSDVTPRDVVQTLKELELSDIFQNRAAIDGFLRILREYLDKGIISVRQSPFWTSYKTFHDLPSSDSVLHAHLCRSDLVIFKGDLNYRKLTLDGLWPHDTQFSTALGPLGNGSGLKILALRTNKADVCVGLKDQRQIDRLDAEAPNNAWVRNGKYAVISFSTGK